MIVVTGASGFIGQALCKTLLTNGHSIRAIVRKQKTFLINQSGNLEIITIKDINATTDWHPILSEADCIIHLAARACNA